MPRPAPSSIEWSANDVLAHLRACADVWGSCIVAILEEDRPTLRAVNPTTWITKTDYRELEFRSSLRSFTAQRADLMAVLEPLPPEGWQRSATVRGAVKSLERTVLFFARWLACHERTHVKQIQSIVKTILRLRRRLRIVIAENGTAVAVSPRPGLRLFYETLALPADCQAPFEVTRWRKRRGSVERLPAPTRRDHVSNRPSPTTTRGISAGIVSDPACP